MKDDFFEFIDSKEKAYWLGFIYAEGYIETRDQKPYRLGIEISKDDEILIDRFIEALDIDPNRKYYREKYHTVIVKFVNKTIVKDLVNLGVVPRKSKIIELPNLSKLELYLAFLLGFYDGDGKTGTTRIITGSKIFLEQIKKLFNLPFKIYEKRSQGYLGTRLIKSHGYSMSLGVVLYNKMLENYHYSLQRKRHEFKTEESRIAKIKEKAWRSNKRKLKIPKAELEELVWQLPFTKIGEKYGVSDKTVKKWCVKWGISTPPRGYWVKNRKYKKKLRNKEEEKQENDNMQEYHEEVHEKIIQKVPESDKKDIEKSPGENQPSEDNNKNKFENTIHENKREHPFDKRFNNEVEEDNFNDPYDWISPKVREVIDKDTKILLDKLKKMQKGMKIY